MSNTCHKMKFYATYEDDKQLWGCSEGCNIEWIVTPSKQGPPEKVEKRGHSDVSCHTFGYKFSKDDLVLNVGIGRDDE